MSPWQPKSTISVAIKTRSDAIGMNPSIVIGMNAAKRHNPSEFMRLAVFGITKLQKSGRLINKISTAVSPARVFPPSSNQISARVYLWFHSIIRYPAVSLSLEE